MKVKIKTGNGTLIDADWTIEGDAMIVSPKGVFEPKNGDVIVCSNALGYWTLIVRKIEPHNIVHYHAVLVDNGTLKINDRSSYTNPRYATEEEKKKLFDKLAKEGWEWDAERKELVKLKWKPKEDECYYRPQFNQGMFQAYKDVFTGLHYENIYCDKGWVFKTEQECQELCGRLNETINNIKP